MAFPNAATLKANAEKLSRPSLKNAIINSTASRGLSEIMDIHPFGEEQGVTADYVIKGKNPLGTAARDPRGTSETASGSPQRVRRAITARQLARKARTSLYDNNVLSDTMSQVDVDLEDQGHTLYEEFAFGLIHGMGGGTQVDGVDKHLGDLCGEYYANTFDGAGSDVISAAKGQKVFVTANDLPGGTRANLSVGLADEMLAKIKGGRSNTRILSNLDTWVDFKKSLNLSGGNTTEMLIGNEVRPAYDNTPWIVSDTVGAAKFSEKGGAITSGAATLVISDTIADQDVFIGFDDSDQGRGIVVSGAGTASADLETTILTVTNRTTVVLADNAATTVSAAQVYIEPDNRMYVIKFDATKGLASFYDKNKAASAMSYNPMEAEYTGTVAGFNVLDLGVSQQEGIFHLHLLMWEGNHCLFNPFSAARATHYDLAN